MLTLHETSTTRKRVVNAYARRACAKCNATCLRVVLVKNGRATQGAARPFRVQSPGKYQSDYFPLAAGFLAVVLVALTAPVFALVDLAAPIFAFGAAGLAAFALVDFAAVALAAVLFAAIPVFLRGEFSDTEEDCRMFVGVRHEQPR